jgi:SAM-dependent methyltransferase
MQSNLKSKVTTYYGQKISRYGAVPQGVDWKDERSQKLRFDQLLKIFGGSKHISLNDLGCGYGAIFLYKDVSKILSRYYGYDICEEMLAQARSLIQDSRAVFINSDRITTEADYSVASGIFNVKLDAGKEAWEEFILDTLVNMNEKSLRGFAFNCLTSYVDYKVDHLYYGDPLFFFDFCKKNFSKYVTLLHDYELYEWTLLVSRKPVT